MSLESKLRERLAARRSVLITSMMEHITAALDASDAEIMRQFQGDIQNAHKEAAKVPGKANMEEGAAARGFVNEAGTSSGNAKEANTAASDATEVAAATVASMREEAGKFGIGAIADAALQDETGKNGGNTSKDEGNVSKEEGNDTKDEGDVSKEEGNDSKDEGDVSKEVDEGRRDEKDAIEESSGQSDGDSSDPQTVGRSAKCK